MCSRRNNHLAILLSCSMEGTISCNTTGWAKNKWNVFSIFSVLEKNYYKRQFGRKLKRKATSKGNFLADFVKPKGCCCGFNCTFTLIYQTVISPSNRIHDCFSPSFFPLELEWPPKYWKNSLGWKSRCWTLLAYYYIIIYHHSLFAFLRIYIPTAITSQPPFFSTIPPQPLWWVRFYLSGWFKKKNLPSSHIL